MRLGIKKALSKAMVLGTVGSVTKASRLNKRITFKTNSEVENEIGQLYTTARTDKKGMGIFRVI